MWLEASVSEDREVTAKGDDGVGKARYCGSMRAIARTLGLHSGDSGKAIQGLKQRSDKI